jgi:hypothetical protein
MRRSAILLCIFTLVATHVAAFVDAQETGLELELNNVKDVQTGCRVAFIAFNGLGTQLDKMVVEVGVFDDKTRFLDMVVFDFGRLPKGKTKIVQYDLAGQCDKISRLVLNSVVECVGGKDMRQECEDRIKTRSVVNIGFGQ